MARVDFTHMAQNTHETDLILLFQNVFWFNLVQNVSKYSLCCDSNPLLNDASNFMKGVSRNLSGR